METGKKAQAFVNRAINTLKSHYKDHSPKLETGAKSDIHDRPLEISTRFCEAYKIGNLSLDESTIHFEVGVVNTAKFDNNLSNAEVVANSKPSTSLIGYFTRNGHSTKGPSRRDRYIHMETENFETVSTAYIHPPRSNLTESDLKSLPLDEAVNRIVTLEQL